MANNNTMRRDSAMNFWLRIKSLLVLMMPKITLILIEGGQFLFEIQMGILANSCLKLSWVGNSVWVHKGFGP